MKKDTTPEMAQKYKDLIMDLSPGQRMIIGCEMFDTAKALAEAGLANEPNPQGHSLRVRLFLRFYGSDFSPRELANITRALEASETQ